MRSAPSLLTGAKRNVESRSRKNNQPNQRRRVDRSASFANVPAAAAAAMTAASPPSQLLPSSQEEVKQLECIICLALPSSVITQCMNGHLMCNSCFNQLLSLSITGIERCPECRALLTRATTARSLVAERAVAKLLVKCSLPDCSAVLPFASVNTHEKTQCVARNVPCMFRPIGCAWVNRADMQAHHQKCCAFSLMSAEDCVRALTTSNTIPNIIHPSNPDPLQDAFTRAVTMCTQSSEDAWTFLAFAMLPVSATVNYKLGSLPEMVFTITPTGDVSIVMPQSISRYFSNRKNTDVSFVMANSATQSFTIQQVGNVFQSVQVLLSYSSATPPPRKLPLCVLIRRRDRPDLSSSDSSSSSDSDS